MKRRIIAIITILAMLICFAPKIDAEAAGGWHIYVNTRTNVVTIYCNGSPVKSLICSTGLPETPTVHGNFSLGYKSRWLPLLGSAGQFVCQLHRDYFFHSVPSETYGDAGSVFTDAYDMLGQNASHGCVRLTVEGAKYIYDNCPVGSAISVIDSNSQGPLGKPGSFKLAICPSIFQRWDPTDRWTAGNPWYDNSAYLGSQVFDPEYYRNRYPDLQKMGDTSLRYHWIAYGIKEGRQASEEFNLYYYKNANSDVRARYGNDNYGYVYHYSTQGKRQGRLGSLPAFGQTFIPKFYAAKYTDLADHYINTNEQLGKHYVNNGLSEGRQGSPVFCIATYKDLNPDLKAAYGNDDLRYVIHFNKFGMVEGRQASKNFDVISYKNAHQDLRLMFGNDLQKYYEHYNNYGYNEGRIATGVKSVVNTVTKLNGYDYGLVYDYNYYTTKYPDIKRTYGNDDIAVLKHFVNFGMKEGRQGRANFDPFAYRNAHPDLRAEYQYDMTKYYYHYINAGYRENRQATNCPTPRGFVTKYNGVDYSAVYNYNFYTNKYKDMKKVYGNDDIAVLRHFVTFGMKEGRQGSADFNLNVYKSNSPDLIKVYGSDNARYYIHYIRFGKSEGRVAK